MALDSYDGLKAGIVTYAFRQGDTDFEAAVPMFVSLCEARINRRLRTGEMEKTETLTHVDGAADLPADYLEFRSVLGSPAYGELSLIPPSRAAAEYRENPGGISTSFTIVGDRLQTYPSGSGTLTISYYGAVPPLGDDMQTNWLLAKAPDLYLYGSLAEAAPFMMDDARLSTWAAMFESGLNDLNAQDERARYSRVTSRIRGETP